MYRVRGTAEFRENPENTCSEYGSGLRQSPKEQPPQLSRSTEDSDHTYGTISSGGH